MNFITFIYENEYEIHSRCKIEHTIL